MKEGADMNNYIAFFAPIVMSALALAAVAVPVDFQPLALSLFAFTMGAWTMYALPKL